MDIQRESDALATLIAIGLNLLFIGIMFIFGILVIIAVCNIFRKAGEKWWVGLVPFYSTYKMIKIGLGVADGKAIILFATMFVPILSNVVQAYMYFGLLKSFGTSNITSAVLSAVGLAPFYMIYLGLSSKIYYRGPIYGGVDMMCPPLGF